MIALFFAFCSAVSAAAAYELGRRALYVQAVWAIVAAGAFLVLAGRQL